MKTYKAGELREDMLVVPVHMLEAATPSEYVRDMVDRNDLACDRAYRNGLMAGFNYGINGDEEGYNRSFNAYQQGIHEASAEFRAKADLHPKNGMEVPKVVAVQYEDGTVLTAADCGSTLEICAKVQTPLMTVAQHSRIVAAKDAEIAKWKHHANLLREDLARLRAQPARQVGEYGDAYQGAREDLAIWKRRALEAEETIREWESRVDSLILDAQGETRMGEPVIPNGRQVGGDEMERFETWAIKILGDNPSWRESGDGELSWQAWQARAALAPAAVVMPLYDDPELHTPGSGNQAAAIGYNAALDEVARLNRRAIPVGLLEKLAHCTDPDCCIAHARGELRALLGKDEGGQ